MHDERRRIEERVERIHDQRIKPAIHPAAVPFDVEAWQAPREPVLFSEAAEVRETAAGTAEHGELELRMTRCAPVRRRDTCEGPVLRL